MTASLNSQTLSGTTTVLVTELSRTGTPGTPGWSVSSSLSTLTGVASSSNTIPNSAFDVSGRSVIQVAGGGTSSAPTGSANMASAQTLFSNASQSSSAVYTGTYTGTSTLTLTPPNGTATDVYNGTLTVTLI
jgi:hypothetical protein